jgi:hypothetical protein
METAEQVKTDWIRDLAAAAGPCITIVLAGNEAGDVATEMKDALQTVRRELVRRLADADALLAPILDAAREFRRSEAKNRGAVALLRSPSVMRIERIRGSARSVVRVDDRFDVRTLLAIASSRKLFYLLALSQNRTRILKCTEDRSEEIAFPAGTPVSLAEAMQTRQPDHVLDNRATAGPSTGSMKGVMFGTSTDREGKDEYLLHFFNEIDKGVNGALKAGSDPLIPVGVEQELALYKRVNTYTGLMEPGIHGAPDGIDDREIRRRAIELIGEHERRFGHEIPADFDKRVGTGRASTHMQDIVAAAWEGRVSHFFFQENATYPGIFDPVRRRVKHTDDPLDSPEELIDGAAYQTILHGGEARIVSATAMPNGVPVCALFRY